MLEILNGSLERGGRTIQLLVTLVVLLFLGLASSATPSPTLPPQSQDCQTPVVLHQDFSATQVAFLVSELQQSLTPGCYAVISTSFAVCLPDLALAEGCCTPDCGRALRLAVTPSCFTQVWNYICSNNTFYTSYVGGVMERCVPQAYQALPISCPVNFTAVNEVYAGLSNSSVMVYRNNASSSVMEEGSDPGSSALAMPVDASQQDRMYYQDCVAEQPKLWPNFNSSFLFDSLLAFARDVPEQCLRSALAYLPSCYDDLTYETGCCSLRCRAAVEKVELSCYWSYLQSLCRRIPNLTKYFFNVASRCLNITTTCAGISNSTSTLILDQPGGSGAGFPVVTSQAGNCPFKTQQWPSFNAVNVTNWTLRYVSQVADGCRDRIAQMLLPCSQDVRNQMGCCSYDCALALRSVPKDCLVAFRVKLCQDPAIATYSITAADRCLGSGLPSCAALASGAYNVTTLSFVNGTDPSSASTALPMSLAATDGPGPLQLLPANIGTPGNGLSNTTGTRIINGPVVPTAQAPSPAVTRVPGAASQLAPAALWALQLCMGVVAVFAGGAANS